MSPRSRARRRAIASVLIFAAALLGGFAAQAPAAAGVQLADTFALVEADPNAPDPVETNESTSLPFTSTASSGGAVAQQTTTFVDSGTGITLESDHTLSTSGGDSDISTSVLQQQFTVTASGLEMQISGSMADSLSGGQTEDQTVVFREVGGGELFAFNDGDDPTFSESTTLAPGTYELEIFGECASGTETGACTADLDVSLELGEPCADAPKVGFAQAQGCFTETEPGSGIFRTDQKAWVGGFEIQPRPGGRLELDTNDPTVSELGAGVDVIFAGFAVPLPAAGLPVSFQNGTVEINQAGSLEKVLLKLPVKGALKVAWTDEGRAASIEAEIEIEKLAAPIGALVSTSSLSTVGQTGGKLKARLVNGQGFVLDAAEVAIQEISVIPSSLRVPRTLTLRNLLLRFEIRDAKPFWTGQAGLRLPLTRGTPLDVTGRVFIFDGSLSGGGLAVDGLNRPLGATPIFLQSVSGDLLFAPTFGFDLTVGGSLGPRINGKQLLTLAGTLQNGEFARADCGGAGLDPAKLTLSSKLTPLEPFTAAGLAEAEMSGRACSFAGAARAMELKAEVKIAFLNEAVAYEASQTGLLSSNGANLEGAAIVKLPAVPDLEGKAIISTKGTAACVDFTFVEAGFGQRWGSGSPPSVFTGCDLGPFQVAVSPRQQRGGASDAIDVPAGLPHAGFAATAASGPPQVTVSGPGGFSVSSPADGSALRSPNAVIVPNTSDNTTYVLVRKPRAGDWRVESTDGSALTEVRFAEGLPDAKVDGRVSKGKKKFRLSYDLRKIDGQKVTLFESGEGIYRKLGKAKAGGGALTFKPTVAADRKRTIEAEVSQDGLPRELITVAKFKAPKLPKLKAPKVDAKRKKKSLKLSWAKVAGAGEYVVEVKAGAEILFRVVTGKTKLRFSDTPKEGKLKVTVQALSEIQPPGPAAKLKVKKPKKR